MVVGVGLGLLTWLSAQTMEVTFSEFTPDSAKGTERRVSAALLKLVEDRPRGTDVVSGTDVTSFAATVSDLPNLAGVAKFAATVTSWIVLRQRYTVDGHVEGTGAEMRLILHLRRGHRAVCSTTVRQHLFDDAGIPASDDPDAKTAAADDAPVAKTAVSDDVASGAAAWLLFSIDRLRPSAEDPRLYGARDWRGLTLQMAAARHLAEPDVAYRVYGNALEYDPNNLASQFGLHNTGLRRALPVEVERAHRRALDRLYATLQPTPAWPPASPLAARVAYARLAAALHEALRAVQDGIPTVEVIARLQGVVGIANEIAVVLNESSGPGNGVAPGDLELYRGLGALAGSTARGAQRLTGVLVLGNHDWEASQRDPQPRVAYNAACLWATPTLLLNQARATTILLGLADAERARAPSFACTPPRWRT